MGVVPLASEHESAYIVMPNMRPAAIAFDAAAPTFDSRFSVCTVLRRNAGPCGPSYCGCFQRVAGSWNWAVAQA